MHQEAIPLSLFDFIVLSTEPGYAVFADDQDLFDGLIRCGCLEVSHIDERPHLQGVWYRPTHLGRILGRAHALQRK